MKFGQQLELGTHAAWKEYYIQYNRLKRIIRRRRFVMDKKLGITRSSSNLLQLLEDDLSKNSHSNSINKPISRIQTHQSTSSEPIYGAVDESTPLTQYSKKPQEDIARNHASVIEINEDTDVVDESVDFFHALQLELDKINKFFIGKIAELHLSVDEIVKNRRNSYRSHHTASNTTEPLKLRSLYVDLMALRTYCGLNQTGFYKIVKKYDKIMEEKTLDHWLKVIDRQPFVTSPDPVQLMDVVTSLVSRDKLIEWEMFANEQQSNLNDDYFPAIKIHGLILSVALFAISLSVPFVTPDDPQASRCMSLLLLTVSLWITEAIPYFATAILIPPLVVFLGVLKDPDSVGKAMATDVAATFVLNHIFNHMTFLLLGGYTISAAFSRCHLELAAASYLQQKLGNRPNLFILAIMMMGLILSMWISNHTAPILISTIILPIVRDLPSDSRFSKALLLGLAFGCNFGGMMTPISSVQNALAVSYLAEAGIKVSFGRWICVSLPFCLLNVLIAWALIIFIVNPTDINTIPVIVYDPNDHKMSKRNKIIIYLSAVTIILFATSSLTSYVFGDIGILALCFLAVMFGTGLLTEVDFNSLSWHTLFLVGGGNVLGKAVGSSGLLEYLADGIIKALPLRSPWLAITSIFFFAGTVATFVSHTVASIILMPIISRIGVTLGIPEAVVIGSAFAVSAAMALPFSSFPNVNSLLIVDDFQRHYLTVQDYLKTGVLMSVLSIVLIATIGFTMINLIMN